MNKRLRLLALLVLVCGATPFARAHDPGLSAAALRLQSNHLAAELTLARGDAERLVPLDADHDGKVSPVEFEAARARLESAARDGFIIEVDGLRVPPDKVHSRLDASDAVQLQLTFTLPDGSALRARSEMIRTLPRGHRQFFSLRDAEKKLLGERIFDANNNSFTTELLASGPAEKRPATAVEFLLLGVEHIATGYDHIVFLLGLLIVGAGFRAVVKIITAFTVAHSVTLALAALNVIRLSPNFVEPLIAVSIMYVGIENIFRRDLERRWRLAFAFGLIHGCGFASALRGAGLGANGTGLVLPLVSFNLGVELGQLALAALVLPVVWKMKQRPSYQPRCVPACSVVIALAGGYWLVERVLGALRS